MRIIGEKKAAHEAGKDPKVSGRVETRKAVFFFWHRTVITAS